MNGILFAHHCSSDHLDIDGVVALGFVNLVTGAERER